MSKSHGARQQKKLAKKKAKNQQQKRFLARQESGSPNIRLAEAEHWPIVAARVPTTLWTTGIGQVSLVRRAPQGQIVLAAFLVDVYCLGVKDAFWKFCPPHQFREFTDRCESVHPMRDVSPEYVAKLIRDAVAYASAHGFQPHPDYRSTSLLLRGIDADLCTDTFEFGRDGKLLYVSGPHESMQTARSRAYQAVQQGGHYMIGITEPLEDWDLDDLELLDEECDDELCECEDESEDLIDDGPPIRFLPQIRG